jgi:hypothetical protein
MKTWSYIKMLSAVLCSAGLLLSTLHIHELVTGHSHSFDHAVHVLDQAHDTCPICAVVSEGIAEQNTSGVLYQHNESELLLYSDQVTFSPIYSAKDGRSPPSIG